MEKLDRLKEAMKNGMIQNFLNDGSLTPMLFYFKNDKLALQQISSESLSNPENKFKLSEEIKEICSQPNVLAAGIIVEANGTKINVADTEKIKSIMNGTIKISELNEREDLIIMIFSTYETEDMIVYSVDVENKLILEQLGDDEPPCAGMFTNLFQWTKN